MRAHLIDVNARVENGRLTARWQYAPAFFHKETIANVATAFSVELARLVDHCLEVEQGQHTPSDFPLADLAQDDLDSLSDLLAELD
jgi:non-ribosomal peptide synthase protein (TIGR01720 family)